MPSLPILGAFLLSLVSQLAGVALVPATRGFTAPLPTAGCVVAFVLGLGVSARMINSGVELSILTPFMTVALQLSVLAVAVAFYGEAVSVPKLCLLVGSALMVGLATRL